MPNKNQRIDLVVSPEFNELIAEVQDKLAKATKKSISRTAAIEFAVAIAHAHLHSPFVYGSPELENDVMRRMSSNFSLLRGAWLTWRDILPQPEEVRK